MTALPDTLTCLAAHERWIELGRPQPCPPLEDLLTAGNARELLDLMFVRSTLPVETFVVRSYPDCGWHLWALGCSAGFLSVVVAWGLLL